MVGGAAPCPLVMDVTDVGRASPTQPEHWATHTTRIDCGDQVARCTASNSSPIEVRHPAVQTNLRARAAGKEVAQRVGLGAGWACGGVQAARR